VNLFQLFQSFFHMKLQNVGFNTNFYIYFCSFFPFFTSPLSSSLSIFLCSNHVQLIYDLSTHIQLSFILMYQLALCLWSSFVSHTSSSRQLFFPPLLDTLFVGKDCAIEGLSPLSETLSNRITVCVSYLRAILNHAGPTLNTLVSEKSRSAFHSLFRLVEDIEEAAASKRPIDMVLTGGTIEAFDKLGSITLTNSKAINRLLLNSLTALKDAKSEIEEIEVKDDTTGDEEPLDDEFDDDFNFGGDSFVTQEEFERVKPICTLLKVVYGAMKVSVFLFIFFYLIYFNSFGVGRFLKLLLCFGVHHASDCAANLHLPFSHTLFITCIDYLPLCD